MPYVFLTYHRVLVLAGLLSIICCFWLYPLHGSAAEIAQLAEEKPTLVYERMDDIRDISQAQHWQGLPAPPTKPGVHWARITLNKKSTNSSNDIFYLLLPASTTWQINLYQPPLYQAEAKFHIPKSPDDPSRLLNFGLPVNASALAGAPIYIEVTEGFLPAFVDIYEQTAYLQITEAYQSLIFGQRALMLFTSLFALFLWVKLGQNTYIIYAAFICSTFLLYSTYNNLWNDFYIHRPLTVNQAAQLFYLIGSASYLFAAAFVCSYGQYSLYSPAMQRLMRGLQWSLAALVVLLLLTSGHPAAVLIATTLWLVTGLAILISAIVVRLKGGRYASYIILGWTPFVTAALEQAAVQAGWLHGSNNSAFFFNVAVIFELVIFQLGLADMMLSYRKERDKAIELACRDALTGSYNRHGLAEMINDIIKMTLKNKQALCVVLIDIDHFKSVNDNYGHDIGDTCLRVIAQAIQTQLRRQQDLLIRYGGEEFLLVLPETDLLAASEICQRIRESIATTNIPTGKEHLRLTVSLGLALFDSTAAFESTVKRADEALYQSKRNGRNRLTIAKNK